MNIIQEDFNKCSSEIFRLEPNEYKGPLVIDRPCIVDGNMSTLWADEGAVLVVKSSGVTVRNLRIEVTGEKETSNNYYAIETDYDNLRLENIEVKGNIKGLSAEPENWELPSLISFGEFASDNENIFKFEIISAADAVISSDIYDLKVEPLTLKKGKNIITFTLRPMRNNTILYGEIFVESVVKHRIYINGKALKDAEVHNNSNVLDEKYVRDSVNIPDSVIVPNVSDLNINFLTRGQRISLKNYSQNTLKFVLEKESLKKAMDIDAYSFLLKQDGKVSCDEDLIFFGNPKSADNSVRIGSNNEIPLIIADISKLDKKYEKIAVCFAIYGDDESTNFSSVNSPVVRIFSGETEIYRFKLENLTIEKTVVAVEIYRYKNEWKLNCIGSGYRDGLKKLCESYGVEVE